MGSPIKCPGCGAYSGRRHCDSPVCDLIRCEACKEHGLEDGRRWSSGPKKKGKNL